MALPLAGLLYRRVHAHYHLQVEVAAVTKTRVGSLAPSRVTATVRRVFRGSIGLGEVIEFDLIVIAPSADAHAVARIVDADSLPDAAVDAGRFIELYCENDFSLTPESIRSIDEITADARIPEPTIEEYERARAQWNERTTGKRFFPPHPRSVPRFGDRSTETSWLRRLFSRIR